MLAWVAVMVSYVVEEQDCRHHFFDRDPTYAGVFLRSPNQRPFGTSRHPARRLKTCPSDGAGAPSRQEAGSKDEYRQNTGCGVCCVTRNLFGVFAPARG